MKTKNRLHSTCELLVLELRQKNKCKVLLITKINSNEKIKINSAFGRPFYA